MKRKFVLVLAFCLVLGTVGCGSESTEEGGLKVEAIETAGTSEKTEAADKSETTETTETTENTQVQETDSVLTEEQALEAVQKYYATIDPEIMNELSSEDYPTYFDVSTNENGEIVVIFRAYTYGVGNAVVKGGRYDNLLKHFGKDAAAVGFSIVVDDLLEALARQNVKLSKVEEPDVIYYDATDFADRLKEAQALRSTGKAVALLPADR